MPHISKPSLSRPALALSSLGALLLVAYSTNASADSCGFFNVQIANHTGHVCKLVNFNFNHGYLALGDTVPSSIRPDDSKHFLTEQMFFFGPDVTLTYQCGEGKITFRSQQGACFIRAGYITGTVISSNEINASHNEYPPSAFYNIHGTIDWELM